MSSIQADLRGTRESLAQRAERLQSTLSAHPYRVFLSFTVLYFALTVLLSAIKVYWFDELITVYIVRAHSLRAIWQALLAGVDQNPPLNHVLTLPLNRLFGSNAVAMRTPSMFAFWIAAGATFLFVRRRVPATFAIGAMLYVFAIRAFDYSFEARPYGLLMASGMVALLAWQNAAEQCHRKIALAALAVALAAGVSSHYYAVLVFFPVAVGELVRALRRGRIDYGVWCAQLLGGLPLLAYLPLIRTDMRLYTSYAWNHPKSEFLWYGYDALLEETIWPVIVLFVAAMVFWLIRRRSDDELLIPAHELAADVTLIALPFVAYAIAVLKTGQVTSRYVLPSAFGVAIGVGIAGAKLGRRKAWVGFALAFIFFCWFGVRTAFMAQEIIERRTQFETYIHEPILKGNLPVLCPDSLIVLPLTFYGPHELSSRIVFPVDFDAVHRYQKEDSAEQTLYAGRDSVFPIHEQNLSDFRAANKKYVVMSNEEGWLIQKLRADGVKLTAMIDRDRLYKGRVDPLFRMRPQLWLAEEK